jgi:flagellar motility protein MotE (MotC chaperone)
MARLQPKVLLPLMICVGITMVGVRAGDIWRAITQDEPFPAIQQAQASTEKPAEKKESEPAKEAGKLVSAAEGQAPAKAEEPKEAKKTEDRYERSNGARDAGSPESDLYKQLAGRRDQLDKRTQELDEREALATVAEKRIDQKIKEMEVMRKQLETLVGQAGASQQAQLENLVKIYEIMKPKEAAKIFETLEMPVLLGVVQKMKPARTAAVMAEMNPEKAKDITVALTKQDQLPQLK